jgi:hypothetical protein
MENGRVTHFFISTSTIIFYRSTLAMDVQDSRADVCVFLDMVVQVKNVCGLSASGRRSPDTPDIWSKIWSNLDYVIADL